MGNFLIGLYFWTLQAMGMTGGDVKPPKIVLATHEQVIDLACEGVPDCKTPIFVNKDGVVLDRSIDWMADPYVASWVVHFMVHYIQANKTPAPPSETEADKMALEMEAVDIAGKFVFRTGKAQEAKI